MAEVTYYVALPFVASDDGVAAGEPTECFNPAAVVMRARFYAKTEMSKRARSRLRNGSNNTGGERDFPQRGSGLSRSASALRKSEATNSTGSRAILWTVCRRDT